jgi:hypothetical protein
MGGDCWIFGVVWFMRGASSFGDPLNKPCERTLILTDLRLPTRAVLPDAAALAARKNGKRLNSGSAAK